MSIRLILLVVAIILFILESLGIKTKISLGWLGMAFFAGAFIA